jgi:hypothetical protein
MSITVNLNPPHYAELNAFDWVSDYLAGEKIRAEIHEAKKELARVKRAPSTNAELKRRLIASYREHQAERLEALGRLFEEIREHPDPWKRMKLDAGRERNLQAIMELSEETIGAAVDTIDEPPGAVTQATKEKLIEKLGQKISDAERKLEKISDPRFFVIKNGTVSTDKRAALVAYWRALQGKCKAPCGVLGFELKESPKPEQKAWKSLQIDRAINKAGQAPSPNRKDYRIAAWG